MKIKALKSFCGTVTMGIGDVRDVEEKMASELIGAGYAQSVEEKTPSKKAEEHGEAAIPEGIADAESEMTEQPQAEPTNKTSKRAKK